MLTGPMEGSFKVQLLMFKNVLGEIYSVDETKDDIMLVLPSLRWHKTHFLDDGLVEEQKNSAGQRYDALTAALITTVRV